MNSYIPNLADIVMLDFDPTLESEQKGRRPAIVLTPLIYNTKGVFICCPITSKSKKYPFEVKLETLKNKIKGVILTDQLRTLDCQARKPKLVDKANPDCIKAVQEKIKLLLL